MRPKKTRQDKQIERKEYRRGTITDFSEKERNLESENKIQLTTRKERKTTINNQQRGNHRYTMPTAI
jgi:hypothetical protein